MRRRKRIKPGVRVYRVLVDDKWVVKTVPAESEGTGFSDKDSQMIFDGDILREESVHKVKALGGRKFIRHWYVCWDDFSNRWIAKYGLIERDLSDYRIRQMVVVGDVIRHRALLDQNEHDAGRDKYPEDAAGEPVHDPALDEGA